MNQNGVLFFNHTFGTPLILRVKDMSVNSYQFIVTCVIKAFLSIKYRSIYLKLGQFPFSLLYVKNHLTFPLHLGLSTEFTYFPDCLPTAFRCAWVTLHSCSLMLPLNAKGHRLQELNTISDTVHMCHLLCPSHQS